MLTKHRATIDDLYKVEGKAEIVHGEIVRLMPTGGKPAYAAREVSVSLRDYERSRKWGLAVTDGAGFHVTLKNRESFCPDAAFYVGPDPGLRFFEGAPLFAVEVRSEGDYGPAAERDMAAKRDDYFEAGTEVVWDVDLLSNNVVRKYMRSNRIEPIIFGRGEVANAEPALPGWKMPVE